MSFFLRLIQDRVRWLAVSGALLGLSALWIVLSASPASTTSGRIPSPREGFLAPEFALDRLDGESMALSEARGKVVVVNLWASWCPPCRAEMPALERLYEAYRDKGLEVLAVNMTAQDNLGDARSFVEQYGLSFPILIDSGGLVANLYHLRALPTTFFIDRDGVIQRVVIGGPLSEVSLRSSVETLLEEGG